MGRKRNNRRATPHRNVAPNAPAGAPSQWGGTWRQQNPSPSHATTRSRYQVLAICALLLLAVGLVFGQTVRHEFVNYDDDVYVYENPPVAHGLTASGIAWVFTHRHCANWHPLTGLSHLVDCQVYGLNASGHHGTNVMLHAATAVALFLVLWRMSGGFWPSAVAAAIFAVHPLRAESVAWVAERKDVLSGLCFMLTLGTYVWYVRGAFSPKRYLLLLVVFALGLMAKPMLVTLPLVLLLLDYWPLGRFGTKTPPHCNGGGISGDATVPQSVVDPRPFLWKVVIEKLPLLLLVAASCAATLWAQKEALEVNERIPFLWRTANAMVSCVAYLGQFFCPAGLAPFYPHPTAHLPLWKVVAAAAVLVGVSVGTLACRRRCPYLLMGWLWYLGMLLPVIGLVQVGSQAMADRYTYLPQIGLCIALAWGAADVCRGWPSRRWACGVGATVVLVALMVGGWRQTTFWHDSGTLWTHALACTSPNNTAYKNLGNALASLGRFDEARAHYEQALKIKPDDAETYNNLGGSLAGQRRFDEAIAYYRKVLELRPHGLEVSGVYKNLGFALAEKGRLQEAIDYYNKALEIKPVYAETHGSRGLALAALGRFDAAAAQ